MCEWRQKAVRPCKKHIKPEVGYLGTGPAETPRRHRRYCKSCAVHVHIPWHKHAFHTCLMWDNLVRSYFQSSFVGVLNLVILTNVSR